MKADALDLLFPVVRAEVLRELFHHTQREMYVREIARWTDLALRTVQRELATLTGIGLVTSRTNGYHVFYRRQSQSRALCAVATIDFQKRALSVGQEKTAETTATELARLASAQ